MSLKNKFLGWCQSEMADRLPWLLLAYMTGILACLIFKINLFVVAGLTGVFGAFFLKMRSHLIISWLAVMSFGFFLGLGNMELHLYLRHHFSLQHSLYQTRITAVVLENQPLIDKQILTLSDIHWQNPDLKMPQKIKVHFKQSEPLLKKGDKISALVSVYPPNDTFSRAYAYQLYFDGIGATGIADNVHLISATGEKPFLFGTRYFINQHLFHILPHSQAEIAAPLITGEQKLISGETYQIYRRAGIAHVLSVSGFHMALLAGFLFFVIRSFCAFFPRIVLYYNTEKLAAVVAFIGTFLYLALSGFQIPAVRAFLMIAFVLLGVWIERAVLSMHSLMLIAFSLLLFNPSMLLSVSFQLSFMAAAVLVAFCQYLAHQPWPGFMKVIVGFLGLNLFVTAALTPFILYHFHQVMPYGILGNMLFSGIFSFFIMPLLFMGALLIPLGGDAPFLRLAGLGLDGVRWGAEQIAHLPNADITVTSFSSVSVSLISFGILMMCWMRTPLKMLGILLILSGSLLGILT